jgi:hypothetical protein
MRGGELLGRGPGRAGKLIRAGRGTDHELEEDDDEWGVVDNAWRIAAKLRAARQELDHLDGTELELFMAERLVEASLRFS